MSFDIGEVLSRAVQITWKHKSFWGLVVLPMLVNFIAMPLYLLPFFFWDENGSGLPVVLENPVFFVLFLAFHFVFFIATFILMIYGYSALTLGVVRVERGEQRISFKELLQDAKTYFPRMLGVMFLTTFVIGTAFSAIFFGLTLFGVVTAGIGFICIQPIFLLLYPVMMIVYAFMEQSQAAVVADEMKVMDAISKAWGLTKSNFWRIALISIVVYFGASIVSSIVVMPFMIPFFFFPFLISEPSQIETSMKSFGWIMLAFSVILLPVMAFVQGVTITFMKSAYILVYLRLTRPSNSPVPVEATA